jgi:hypothetical protein
MTFNPFSALTSKVFGGLLILSLVTLVPALLITRTKLFDARETIAALEQWQDDMVIAVRLASGNKDTTDKTAVQQVNRMGVIRIKLGEAVESQSGQIEAMQRESDAALAVAEKAKRERAAAIRRTEKLQAELRARARVPAPAEDMDAAVRRSQDDLYEAGL